MLVVYDITFRQSWESVKRWVEDVRRSLPDHEPMIPFILGTCTCSSTARATFTRALACAFATESLTPDGLLAVVGAKSDLTSQRQVSAEEGKALADEVGAIGWTEVSSLTGANGKLASLSFDDDDDDDDGDEALRAWAEQLMMMRCRGAYDGSSSVDETFFRLSEVALLGLDPFAHTSSSSSGAGFQVPSEELLLQLYAKSSGGLQAGAKKDAQPVKKCLLQ
jgi:GTPase SAR1 family protein